MNLHRMPMYEPARNTFLFLTDRPYWQRRVKNLRDFYQPFIPKGGLVFDVGANVGEYARAFVGMGAGHVVAVEPSPECVKKLKAVCNPARVSIEACAVGSKIGTATFHLNEHQDMGTLSEAWKDVATKSARLEEMKFAGEITVPVVTMNSLIERYGMPDFLKVDVEGHESEAFKGLTKAPRFVSFEFNPEWTADAIRVLQSSCFPRQAICNYIVGEPSGNFELKQWVPIDRMIEVIRTDFHAEKFGDIVVRS